MKKTAAALLLLLTVVLSACAARGDAEIPPAQTEGDIASVTEKRAETSSADNFSPFFSMRLIDDAVVTELEDYLWQYTEYYDIMFEDFTDIRDITDAAPFQHAVLHSTHVFKRDGRSMVTYPEFLELYSHDDGSGDAIKALDAVGGEVMLNDAYPYDIVDAAMKGMFGDSNPALFDYSSVTQDMFLNCPEDRVILDVGGYGWARGKPVISKYAETENGYTCDVYIILAYGIYYGGEDNGDGIEITAENFYAYEEHFPKYRIVLERGGDGYIMKSKVTLSKGDG